MQDHATLVNQQYSRQELYQTILDALQEDGVEADAITREKLAGVDEFHVRGQEVTREMAALANLSAGTSVLDVGCGLGGPARLLADEYGCEVTGIDLTEEYIRTANQLSKLTRLDGLTHFITGNALELPFTDGRFDVAWTQHVQMNISDKNRFYQEIARVLKPGGRFMYYDIFSVDHQPIQFPVPWADNPTISHLMTLAEYRSVLTGAGLEEMNRVDQTARGIQFFRGLLEKLKTGSIPRISLRLLMGQDLPLKIANLLLNLEEGRLTLESGICVKRIGG